MLRRPRRPSHAIVISYLALFIALGGASYAAVTLPANSVGTKQIKNRAVTLGKISQSARGALKGARGPAGAPCLPTVAACRGPQGPGATGIFIDTQQAYTNKVLAKVGPWTIVSSCTNAMGSTQLSVTASGPSDTVGDGSEDAHAYSFNGAKVPVADPLSIPSAFGYHTSDINLFSPSQGSAHISLYDYAQSPSAMFRCKVNASAYGSSNG
jgi:hypothetical protein